MRCRRQGHEHGRVAERFGRRIGNFVEDRDLGHTVATDTGIFIEHAPDTVRAPDHAFISYARMAGPPPSHGYAEVVPDLVVEVVIAKRQATRHRRQDPNVAERWRPAGAGGISRNAGSVRPPRRWFGDSVRQLRYGSRRPGTARIHLPSFRHICFRATAASAR